MRQSEYRRGFTLIELLVVIAIIALLMAILVPALRRARNQARTVVCQSRQKQWGLLMDLFVNDHGGRFLDSACDKDTSRFGFRGLMELGNGQVSEDMLYCPMAAKVDPAEWAQGHWLGGTFLAWGTFTSVVKACEWPSGSYGPSSHVGWRWNYGGTDKAHEDQLWQTIDVRGQNIIPALLDSGSPQVRYWDNSGPTPPECDAVPTVSVRQESADNVACINRHNGGVNALFLDWSVRKVGLKELWTLKWHKEFSTANQWTKAGGAEPGDWPQWMRGFKDY